MPFFKTKKLVSIHYQIIDETGSTEAEKETCILIGGLTRDLTIWRKLTPLLQKDFRILIFDNRDAGQTTFPISEYSTEDLADDVAEMITGLKLGPVHIAGHSMGGGFMAMFIASKYPSLVKSLALCSTHDKQVPAAIKYLTERVELIKAAPPSKASTASEADIRAVMPKLYAPKTLEDKAFVAEIIAHETSNPCPQGTENFMRQAIACIHHDATKIIGAISCPAIVTTGAFDKYYTPALATELASKIKSATAITIPDAGHMIQLEQPELLYTAMKSILFNKADDSESDCKPPIYKTI